MQKELFTVLWTETSFKDLESIIDHIAFDSIDSALDIYYKLKNKSNTLTSRPLRVRIVPELQFHNILTYRELIVTPWRIIYRMEGNTVYVLSVFDGRRSVIPKPANN
ncbi:MAG: type II toxin-antitoxin system RelE/ParE family toxin [Spirochaetes bacterium]|nr:type II toxin-antitoxin system RelE/ParE family toxin [Spirochaetota bacterium]